MPSFIEIPKKNHIKKSVSLQQTDRWMAECKRKCLMLLIDSGDERHKNTPSVMTTTITVTRMILTTIATIITTSTMTITTVTCYHLLQCHMINHFPGSYHPDHTYPPYPLGKPSHNRQHIPHHISNCNILCIVFAIVQLLNKSK